ncbi:MAG: PAAR domain-containing protein [Myxococcales bacterium]|nr:PAAR domain-containing protein [Myxococcales bacterium]
MSRPVAKRGDHVVAVDSHLIVPETGGPPLPTPVPFDGVLQADLSPNVLAQHQPVALVDSIAHNTPEHLVAPKTFAKPPANRARIVMGSATVLANGRPIARSGDKAETCNDPVDLPIGTVMAAGTVVSG